MDVLTEKAKAMSLKATFAPRKPAGTRGAACPLKTNMWRLTLKPNLPIYKYDIRINVLFKEGRCKELTKQTRDDYNEQTRKAITVAIYKRLCEEKKNIVGKSSFYDRAAILFSLEMLKDSETDLPADYAGEVPFDGHIGFQVTIKKVQEGYQTNTNDLNKAVNSNPGAQDLTIFEALNVILGQEALMNPYKWVTYGNAGHYLMDENDAGFRAEMADLSAEGKYMGIGAKKAVKVVDGLPNEKCAAFVGVEVIKTAFHCDDQMLAEKIGMYKHELKGDVNSTNKAIRDLIKGVFVYPTHLRNKNAFPVCGLAGSANQTFFEGPNGRISVAQYYREKYDMVLKYPDLPLVVAHIKGKDCYFPSEVLNVAKSQRVTTAQQTPNQMASTIRACATVPEQRKFQCDKMKQALNINSNSKVLQSVGISVAQEAQDINGRQLQAPAIVFGEKKQVRSADNAKWSGDHVKYECPAVLTNWTVVILADQRDVKRLNYQVYIQKLADRMMKFGMTVSKPQVIADRRPSRECIDSILSEAQVQKKQLVFFITSDSITLHDFIKYRASAHQVLTQEVRVSKVLAVLEKGQNQTLDNVVNKTNLKLGGVNYSILLPAEVSTQNLFSFEPSARKFYVGIEMSHPAPLSGAEKARNMGYRTPSVLGWGANYAKHPQYFLGDYRYIKPRESDMIGQELYNLSRFIITKFRSANSNHAPNHIIMYLNGISQGQWALVCTDYMKQLKAACTSLSANYQPKFTILVVSKDHTERLFRKQIPNSRKAADQNVPPGTVVDTTIVSPSVSEFYLNSHSAFQGTAKTPKYSVIVDEANMSMDQLEAMTHGLCFMHGIVNMSISVPAPLKVAGECAKRGLNVFHQIDDSTSGEMDLNKYNSFINIGGALSALRYNA